MSELGVGGLRGGHRTGHGRGCLAALVALAIVAALAVFTYVKGVDVIRGALAGPADFKGDGNGSVVVEVEDGDSGADIGATLKAKGVVKSVEAFTDAASADERSSTIQAGFYKLHEQMSGQAALDLLLDPKSKLTNMLTIPEGMRAKEILAKIVDETDFTARQVNRAYADTKALGVPPYAHGDPEGYLFPSTYDVPPKSTAAALLKRMVGQYKLEAGKAGMARGAHALGVSPHDVVVVASLVQAESRDAADMAKVASVIYNRLDAGMPLQLDSTLHYAVDSRGEVAAGKGLRALASPYNTYRHAGLPPTPIDSPGADALDAAVHPATSDYRYFVTVNLATGETRFARTYRGHLRNVERYKKYCSTSDEC